MADIESPEEQAARMQAIHACLERHKAFEADPEAWKGFLRRVAAGESPGYVCDRLGLNLFELNAWIRADNSTIHATSRRGLMDEALVTRSEALKWALEDQLHAVATFDVRTLFDGDQLRPVAEWPAEIGRAVAGLDVEALFDEVNEPVDGEARVAKEKRLIGYLKKFKVWDKLKAIDSLGKQHGMFKDKTTERIADSLESLLAKSFESK